MTVAKYVKPSTSRIQHKARCSVSCNIPEPNSEHSSWAKREFVEDELVSCDPANSITNLISVTFPYVTFTVGIFIVNNFPYLCTEHNNHQTTNLPVFDHNQFIQLSVQLNSQTLSSGFKAFWRF